MYQTIIGILIPFIGTTLGAACVFFLRGEMNEKLRKVLTGFAAGVMTAASFWSLLDPALSQAEGEMQMGRLSFVPAAAGFLTGMFFLLALDILTPHMHLDNTEEGPGGSGMKRTTKLILAVTLHNIPEGMAVGIVYAGWLAGAAGAAAAGTAGVAAAGAAGAAAAGTVSAAAAGAAGAVTAASALALSLGIAIQNFPEGAIVSMPLRAEGMSKPRTFFYGMLSGAVEPVAALITIFAAQVINGMMPYLLSFAAGAMMYVVVEELIPEMSEGTHSNLGPVAFAFGFVVMMALDVALG